MFPKEAAPVNGVPRGVVTMGAGAHRNQPLGVFWFLFHVEKELTPGAKPWKPARRVVAQASLSCPCGAIHLLAPYGGDKISEAAGASPRPTGCV